jgi:hypothetical protein
MDLSEECPVCGERAIDITSMGFDGRSIRCVSCGDYDIGGRALMRILATDISNRRDALALARRFARNGQRPSIDRKCI